MKQPIVLTPLYQNVSEESQRQGSTKLINSYVDEAGAWRGSPGLLEYADVGIDFPVQSWYWQNKKYLIHACNNKLFYQASDGGAVVEITLSGIALDATKRISFVGDKYRLYFAWGGKVATWLPGSDAVYCSVGTIPSEVTHLAIFDGYIMANDIVIDAYYYATPNTGIATGEPTWAAGDTAQGMPDTLTAIAVEWRDMLLAGPSSIEMWYNAGTPLPASPFLRREGSFIQRGIIAPHTLKGVDNTWYWLDHERKVVQLQGVTPKVISSPIDLPLSKMDNVVDAYGMTASIGGKNWYVLTIPSEGKTYAYEYGLQQWSEWGEWLPAIGKFEKYPANAMTYSQDWNKIFIGSTKSDGKVYVLDLNTFSLANGILRRVVETAYIDRGSSNSKRCDRLQMRIKAGQYIASGNARLSIRYKDDGKPWSQYRHKDLGTTGETEFMFEFRTLGIYKARKWEFVFTSPADLVVQAIEEDFTVLLA